MILSVKHILKSITSVLLIFSFLPALSFFHPTQAEKVNSTFLVYGYVTDSNGVGVPNVTVTAEPGWKIFLPITMKFGSSKTDVLGTATLIFQETQSYPTAVTDANGFYVFSALSEGSYNLVPSRDGFEFAPLQRFVDSFTTGNQNFDVPNMIQIPQGNFLMGCDSTNLADTCNRDDELPLHLVTLNAYYIDKFEVTNAQYARCVAAGVCTVPQAYSSYSHSSYYDNPTYASFPVIWVNWNQANAYCAWAGKRLPTEAEWEKAARGSADTRVFAWGNQTATCELGNFYYRPDGCAGDTVAVGSYSLGVSPYGVYDMSGNVWEWVNDWYSSTYYSLLIQNNPTGPATGSERVIRGGSWSSYDNSSLRVPYRRSYYPTETTSSNGIRCADSLTGK